MRLHTEVERFARGEPIAVEVGEIERALGELWQQASRAGDVQTAAVSRAALWNAIFPACGRSTLATTKQLVDEIAPARTCDVMIDTGMNRLGVRPDETDVLDGLSIDTLHSHLACADEDCPLNQMQLERFRAVAAHIEAARYSLANSAGICLGTGGAPARGRSGRGRSQHERQISCGAASRQPADGGLRAVGGRHA